MAILSTPVNSSALFTYQGDDVQPLRINGIRLGATPMQLMSLLAAIQPLQSETIAEGYHIAENDLTEA
jgi:hypothetical protein